MWIMVALTDNMDFQNWTIYLVAHPTARKWVITPVINGISRVNPLITGVITHLLSGMSHQVGFWTAAGFVFSSTKTRHAILHVQLVTLKQFWGHIPCSSSSWHPWWHPPSLLIDPCPPVVWIPVLLQLESPFFVAKPLLCSWWTYRICVDLVARSLPVATFSSDLLGFQVVPSVSTPWSGSGALHTRGKVIAGLHSRKIPWDHWSGGKNICSGWWFGTWILFIHILGMSSSQLTNSIIFPRGWFTSNQCSVEHFRRREQDEEAMMPWLNFFWHLLNPWFLLSFSPRLPPQKSAWLQVRARKDLPSAGGRELEGGNQKETEITKIRKSGLNSNVTCGIWMSFMQIVSTCMFNNKERELSSQRMGIFHAMALFFLGLTYGDYMWPQGCTPPFPWWSPLINLAGFLQMPCIKHPQDLVFSPQNWHIEWSSKWRVSKNLAEKWPFWVSIHFCRGW